MDALIKTVLDYARYLHGATLTPVEITREEIKPYLWLTPSGRG